MPCLSPALKRGHLGPLARSQGGQGGRGKRTLIAGSKREYACEHSADDESASVSKRHMLALMAATWPAAAVDPACAMIPDDSSGPQGFKMSETIPTKDMDAVLDALSRLSSVLDKYSYLASVKEDKPGLFFSVLMKNPETVLPIVYTPGVGDACLNWGRLKTRPTGLTLTLADAGSVAAKMKKYAAGRTIDAVVVTDGNRILGLGDLGASGMGIPVGKCALYAAAGGFQPQRLLPVVLDVGCSDAEFRASDAYVGEARDRETGEAYDRLVAEFHAACQANFGADVLIHWEDFGSSNAARFLERYRGAGPTFNDDIQSTAAVALAALLGATRLPDVPPLSQQTFMFVGAGQASLGIAELLVEALADEGLSEEDAKSRIWMLDSRGLIGDGRDNVSADKARFAQSTSALRQARVSAGVPLLVAIKAVQPTSLIGAAGKAGIFTADALGALEAGMPPLCAERGCDRAAPTVLALSNPTRNAECTFAEARAATRNRVVFAAGSPFPPAEADSDGARAVASQANNALVFPGLGAAVALSGATAIPSAFFMAAARALAEDVTAAERAAGYVVPPVRRIRGAALAVAVAVCMQSNVDMVSTGAARPDVARAASAAVAATASGEDAAGARARLRKEIDDWRF